jgi:hypothetical protein
MTLLNISSLRSNHTDGVFEDNFPEVRDRGDVDNFQDHYNGNQSYDYHALDKPQLIDPITHGTELTAECPASGGTTPMVSMSNGSWFDGANEAPGETDFSRLSASRRRFARTKKRRGLPEIGRAKATR